MIIVNKNKKPFEFFALKFISREKFTSGKILWQKRERPQKK